VLTAIAQREYVVEARFAGGISERSETSDEALHEIERFVPLLDKTAVLRSVFDTEDGMASWTTVYWGPVVEADVVLAALRAAGLPAELVYQSTGPGVVPGPGPTDSRVVVPEDYARPAARLVARAGRQQMQSGPNSGMRPSRGSLKMLVARAVALLFLAGILWTLANMMFAAPANLNPPPNPHLF
jgi:hypothetical protein